jgi:hypothetical protein
VIHTCLHTRREVKPSSDCDWFTRVCVFTQEGAFSQSPVAESHVSSHSRGGGGMLRSDQINQHRHPTGKIYSRALTDSLFLGWNAVLLIVL